MEGWDPQLANTILKNWKNKNLRIALSSLLPRSISSWKIGRTRLMRTSGFRCQVWLPQPIPFWKIGRGCDRWEPPNSVVKFGHTMKNLRIPLSSLATKINTILKILKDATDGKLRISLSSPATIIGQPRNTMGFWLYRVLVDSYRFIRYSVAHVASFYPPGAPVALFPFGKRTVRRASFKARFRSSASDTSSWQLILNVGSNSW